MDLSTRKWMRRAGVAAMSVVLAGALAITSEHSSTAQDAVTATSELSGSDDFRVRVQAAMYLGKSKSPAALPALTSALSDPHPAVRTAAAVALRALGNPAAIGALASQMKRENADGTRAQMATSIEALHALTIAAAPAASVKYAVKMGNMKNLTNVRGDALGAVMQRAAKSRAASIPGAVLVDDDAAAAKVNAPMLVLDGTITKMKQESKVGGTVNFLAQVEFSVSKMPEHALKVALHGGATSIGTQSSLVSTGRINALQDQAVDGAVESALRGCDVGLDQAVK